MMSVRSLSLQAMVRSKLNIPLSFTDDTQTIYLSHELKYCYYLLKSPVEPDASFMLPRIEILKNFLNPEKTDLTGQEYRVLKEKLLNRLSKVPERPPVPHHIDQKLSRARLRSHSAPCSDSLRFDNYYPYMRLLQRAKWDCLHNTFIIMKNVWDTKPLWYDDEQIVRRRQNRKF
jgi:hypothetical protein